MGLKSFDSGGWRWDVLSQHQHLQKSNTSAVLARVWKAGAHNAEKLQEEVAQLNEEAPCPWDPQTCFWLTSVGCTNNSTMRYLSTCALLVRVLCLVMLARKRRTRWYLGVVGPLVASSRSCCSAAHWRTRKSIARGVVNILSMQLQLDSFCCLGTPQDCRHCWKTFYCEICNQEWAAHALLTLCSRFAHACSRFAHASLMLRSRFAHALLTLAHALLTLAHALLTLCSRFAHALLTLCSHSLRFLLSPLDSFRVLTRNCSRCARFAHALLEVSIHGRFATKTARTKCNGFGKSKDFVVLQTCVPCVGLIFQFYTTWSRLPSITLTYVGGCWALFSSVSGYLGPIWGYVGSIWGYVGPMWPS